MANLKQIVTGKRGKKAAAGANAKADDNSPPQGGEQPQPPDDDGEIKTPAVDDGEIKTPAVPGLVQRDGKTLVRIETSMAGPHVSWTRGDLRFVSDAEAKRMVESGAASAIDPDLDLSPRQILALNEEAENAA